MKRERIAWSVSLLLLVISAFNLNPSLANRDDDYSFVSTLVAIHRKVATDYVESVDETKLQQAAIDGMLSQLDPYTQYIPPAKKEDFDRMLEGTFRGVGVELRQRDDGKIEVVTPIEGSPAFRAGVQPGDILVKINGETISGQRLPDVTKRIGGEAGSEVKLVVQRDGKDVELSMRRDEIVVPTVKGFQRKADNAWDYYVCENPKIAYVRLTQFTPTSFEAVKSVLTGLLKDGMQGLIFDLRFNPGGQLDQAEKIVNLFLPEGRIVVTRGRNRPETIKMAERSQALPYFPMIVLVNEHSASASEIVAGSLMDNKRALVVGTRSFGKGSVQELVPLDGNNGELKITVAYYYLPSGRLVHKKKDATDWGVEPQIPVPMDEEAQQRMLKERMEQENLRRAGTRPSTRPAPTTQPTDPQLQRAVDTLLATIILQGGRPETSVSVSGPTTRPTTQEVE